MSEPQLASGGNGFSEDMLNKKMNQVFKWWDQNGDGLVTEDDVEKMATNFTALATDEKHKSLMRKGIFNWWQLMLKDREDKTSDKLGKQEFIRSMRSFAADPTDFKVAIGSVIDGMLAALDKDGNGVLSQEEYIELYKGVGLPGDVGIEVFKRLDRNSNGEIDHKEFEQAIYEYYLSPDPNAPGQWLYGPPEYFEI